MSAPLVSVLIRSMDRPQLARALDSVAAQTHAAIEVIVVAACGPSHRALPAQCGAFPLRLVVPPQPLGRAAAANAALDAARGEWLNLLDDDDAWLPEHVSALLGALRPRADVRFAYARSRAIGADGSSVECGVPFKPWRQLDTGFFHSQAALFARSLCDEGVRFDPALEILEDLEFFVQCAQRTPFVFVDRVTSISYRDEGSSGTGSQRDAARIARATDYVRHKWRALEQHLHAMPEFRRDKALWLLERNEPGAGQEINALFAARPDWVDAQTLAALHAAQRGDAARARQLIATIAARTPDDAALARHLDTLRNWLRAA